MATRSRSTTKPAGEVKSRQPSKRVGAPPLRDTDPVDSNGDEEVPLPKAGAGQISAADAPIEFDRWLWRNYIPEGVFMVLSGAGGVGKSSLIAYILSGLSKGTLEGDFEDKPQNSIWYSREDSTTVSLKGKLVAGQADQRRVILMDQNGERGGITLTLPADLDKLAELVEQNHHKVVVLDLLMSFVETKRSLHQNYGNVVQVFTRIAEMCATKKVTIIGVMHNKSKATTVDAESVVSSIAIPGVGRHLLMVGHLADTGNHVLSVAKSNCSPPLTGYVFKMTYVDVAKDPETGKPKQASRIEMLRPASKAEVMASLQKPKSTSDALPQIRVVLKALENAGELATTDELYPLVVDELGVKPRRFRDIVAEAVAIGVIDSRVTGQGGSQRHLVKINKRGLKLIPPDDDGLVHEDDEGEDETFISPKRPQAEVIFQPDE